MKSLPIMSVSGIRGKMDETISAELYAVIAHIQTKHAGGGKIVVGRDTRPSGDRLAKAVFSGIRSAGGIPVDIGIAPTPTTCFATKHFNASSGIIITASHNPLPYNGYKMVHSSGRLFSGQECENIYRTYKSSDYESAEKIIAYENTPSEKKDAVSPHLQSIVAAVDSETIRRAGIRIAVDSINGAAGVIFPRLLEKLSVQWQGVHNGLDGNFVHNPEPRPQHLADLACLLKTDPAFWGGFAFDPDADRLAAMGERGEAVSEEMTLALCMENILSVTPSPVAVNLSTSMVIDDVAQKYGSRVIRTKIGEANVVEAILKHSCIIGGEGNGGVIYPRVAMVRDGLTGLALILELLAKTGKKLNELISNYPTYSIVKEKIDIQTQSPSKILSSLVELYQHETIDTQDGLKIIRPGGWVHIRPSNTEPILRCYAEAQSASQARQLADMILGDINRI